MSTFTKDTVINSTFNIKLSDLIYNETAVKYSVDNLPTEEHYNNLVSLVNDVIVPCCNYFGYKIKILSCYISEELSTNYLFDNNVDSLHLTGQAVDLSIVLNGRGNVNSELFNYIKTSVPFDQLIWVDGTDVEPNYVHISYYSSTENNRSDIYQLKVGNSFPVILK
jgi:hypothetical protein